MEGPFAAFPPERRLLSIFLKRVRVCCRGRWARGRSGKVLGACGDEDRAGRSTAVVAECR